MFSWKWASNCVDDEDTAWPLFEVNQIEYIRKGIESLPDSWTVEVSEGCQASACHPTSMDLPTEGACHIKLTVQGSKCPTDGCTLLTQCGSVKDCATGELYDPLAVNSSGSNSLVNGAGAQMEQIGMFAVLALAHIMYH